MPRTGPHSTSGSRRRSSRNSVRHGLRSLTIVIPGLEEEADWDKFLRGVIKALKPVGAMEYALAERAASLMWRLRRVPRAERDAAVNPRTEEEPLARNFARLGAYFRDAFYEGREEDRAQDEAVERELGFRTPEPSTSLQRRGPPRPPSLMPDATVLHTLSRYEYRLSRQLVHTIHELHALQALRLGQEVPLARLQVDVEGLPRSA